MCIRGPRVRSSRVLSHPLMGLNSHFGARRSRGVAVRDGQSAMRQVSILSRVAWTTAGLLLAWLNLDGRSHACAGGFSPGISVGSRVDERSSSVVNAGRWVGLVAPQLTIARSGPASSWQVSALRSFESYSSSPAPKPATDLDSLRVWGAPISHSVLSLDGAYLRSKDLFYLAPGTPLPTGQSELASGSLVASSSIEEATYKVRAANYEAAGKSDALAQAWSAAVIPM